MSQIVGQIGDSTKTSMQKQFHSKLMQKQFHSKLLILKLPRMAPGFITYDIETQPSGNHPSRRPRVKCRKTNIDDG
jgi:hypothetical protein